MTMRKVWAYVGITLNLKLPPLDWVRNINNGTTVHFYTIHTLYIIILYYRFITIT